MSSVPLHFPKQFMSSYTHPSIPSDHDVEDPFSSTNKISSLKDTETPVESSIPVFPSSSVGSSSPVRFIIKSLPNKIQKQQGKTTRLDLHRLQLSRIQPLYIPPKRTSTSETLTMTQAAMWQLIADGIAATLEA
ncbi:hypothetical protein Tco_0832540 [Tanacetum coccineum]